MASNDERGVTKADLDLVDEAIANHEFCQGKLYMFRKILGEVFKIDGRCADLTRGVEDAQLRFNEAHQRTNVAQIELDEVKRQITEKRRELAEVEKIMAERRVACDELNNAINHLRAMLAAA
jgi:predicted nuclease with TOPRIM domain